MVTFVFRGPTNIEAENIWKDSSQLDIAKVTIFPQHSLMFMIHFMHYTPFPNPSLKNTFDE